MTKKDYILIADILNNNKDLHAQNSRDTIKRVAEQLADKMILDNPLFNKDKFLTACGFNS